MKRSPERWPVWRAAFSEAGQAAAGGVRRLVRVPRLRAPSPDRLVVAPYDLRTSDPTVAAEIASGLFRPDSPAAAGLGASNAAEPSPARSLARHGFGWLRHLRAGDTAAARENARALVAAAIGPRRRELEAGPGRETAIVARRLISFLGHSPLVLTGADHGFYVAYLRAIGRDADALDRDMRASPRPVDRLLAAIGLCFAGLCCTGLERQLRRGTRALAAELDAQILPDGGHVGRNGGLLIDLLLDLLPLKSLYEGRGVDPPAALETAIERSLPMLRFLRHGSGDLALFNGTGRTPASDVATILSHDPRVRALEPHAPQSGYDRLEAAGTVVLLDTGSLPPLAAASDAHAGVLSLELSSGRDRIVVNCGAPSAASPHRTLARRTAAHSTVTLAEASSASVLADGGSPGLAGSFLLRRLGPVLLPGPSQVQRARRRGRNGAERVSGQHDGYRHRFGAVHARRLELSADGSLLRGSDTLTFEARRSGPLPAVVRFHLHPDVVAGADPDGSGILLALRSGERWLFSQEGGRLLIEDSAFFAVPEPWRPTAQIAIELSVEPDVAAASCRWQFRRLAVEAAEPLPEAAGMVSAPGEPDPDHAP